MTSKGYVPAGYSGSESDSDSSLELTGSRSVGSKTAEVQVPHSSAKQVVHNEGRGRGHPGHHYVHQPQPGFREEQQQQRQPQPPPRPQQYHQNAYTPQPGYMPGRGRGRGMGWGRGCGYSGGGSPSQDQRYHQYLGPGPGYRNRFNSNEHLQEEQDKKKALLAKITGLRKSTSGGGVVECLKSDYALSASSKFKAAWDANDAENFHRVASSIFQNCLTDGWDMWALGLFCTMNAADFTFQQMGFQSIAVMRGLKDFISAQKVTDTLSDEFQVVAIEAALNLKKMTDLKLFVELFKLATSGRNQLFIPNIQTMCSNKNFGEACQCATYLQLQDHFDIHAFLVPLLLQDRYNMVEEFVQNSPELQQNIVKFLDGAFVDNFPERLLNDYIIVNKIPKIKMDKISHKPMGKLVKRLVARFNIPSSCYPNVGHRQRFGELRFLFSRRYDKQEMSVESFDELVNQIAEGSSKMKEDVLSHYLMYGDCEGAAKFIIVNELYSSTVCLNPLVLLHLPEPHKSNLSKPTKRGPETEENWDDDGDSDHINSSGSISSHHVNKSSSPMPASGPNHDEDDWDDQNEEITETVDTKTTKNYYKCVLPRDRVKIIDSPATVLELCKWMNDIRPNADGEHILSGFDSEWKPIMSRRQGVALLQLAFEDNIFIVDVVALKQNPEQNDSYWKSLRKSYFENESILKLGFGVTNDVKMLSETIREWEELNKNWKSVLDLSQIKSMIVREDPQFFSSTAIPGETGLSELVNQCLGKSLSKSEQMSDWEKRPLREPQIRYAADDAFCLIDVFKAMKEIAKSSRVDLNKIVRTYLKGSSESGIGSKKVKIGYVGTVLELLAEEVTIPADPDSTPNDQSSVSLVADNMLQGLGRYLRVLGFNTIIVNNNQGHGMCGRYAGNSRRVITKGIAYNEIVGTVSEDKVYKVNSDKILDQLQEICRVFNVRLQHSKLFVICLRCNTSEFIKVSNRKMMELFHTSGISKRIKVDSFNLGTFKGAAPDDMILCVGDSVKDWKLLGEEALIVKNGGYTVLTTRGLPVELHKLQSFAQVIDWLYVCNECGKCYWESAQVEKLIRESQDQTTSTKEDKEVAHSK